jgi:homoaconitase/3-isopropylmalate dehydratase large subunit
MSSIMTAPRGVLRNRAMNTRQIPSPITITRSNGEVIVIDPTSKVVKSKRKAKVKRSSRKVIPLTHKVSEQDIQAIELQERIDKFVRENQIKALPYL